MKFGAHVSIAVNLYDAVDRAVAIGCDAMQIFPGNPRGWHAGYFKAPDIVEFNTRRRAADIGPIAIHLPYLVNLASPVDRVFEASLDSVKDALEKAKSVEADFLVIHVGSHVGAGREFGLERIKRGLDIILKADFAAVRLLLENTAGAGYTLGDRFEEIAEIIRGADKDRRLGICLDTCHAYAAGYDLANHAGLEELLEQIHTLIGLDRLGLIHANDCKGGLGNHLDRHENIGHGHIGIEGFRSIVNHPALSDMTCIIETPRREDPFHEDRTNLRLLRSLVESRP